MSARGLAAKHFRAALARWPKDPLRPDSQLQDVLAKRLDASAAGPAPAVDLPQANALYSLLENRYRTRYRVREDVMLKPRSNPSYYSDLIRELDAAPTRSALQRMLIRLGGMFRLR